MRYYAAWDEPLPDDEADAHAGAAFKVRSCLRNRDSMSLLSDKVKVESVTPEPVHLNYGQPFKPWQGYACQQQVALSQAQVQNISQTPGRKRPSQVKFQETRHRG